VLWLLWMTCSGKTQPGMLAAEAHVGGLKIMTNQSTNVVIVGGGFAGLAAAKALRKTPAKVILIDRTYHYLFQPLLYQVATSELTAGQIATPIRRKVRISGFVAWLVWAVVHLQFLATSSLRLSVFLQWVWTYVTGQRGDRLIVSHRGLEVTKPGLDTPVKATFASRQSSGPGQTEDVKPPTVEAKALREAL